MKQQDAKQQIVQLWSKRNKNKLTMLDILGFYLQLEKEHPELLKFQYRGNKYQIVKAWLTPYASE